MIKNKNIYYILIAALSFLNLFLLIKEIDTRKEIVKNIKELHCIELLVEKEKVDPDTIRNKCHYYSATGVWQRNRYFKLKRGFLNEK
tara:strand:+ start:225 stop:485 length:261 start_codon:yes stop_codon:yes gene_type:complete